MTAIEKKYHFVPSLEDELKQELPKFHRASIMSGESHARRNLPPLSDCSIKSYFGEIHRCAEAMLNKISMAISKTSLIAEVQEDEKQRDGKVREIDNKLDVIKEKKHEAESKVATHKEPHSKMRLWIARIAICLPLFGDAVISIPVWETWGFNFLESVIISLVFAGALVSLAHFFERIVYHFGKTPWQRRVIATLLFLLVVAANFYMADARTQYRMSQLAAQGIAIHLKPIPFVLVSTLLFLIALAISKFVYPTREQQDQMREYQNVKAEYGAIVAEEKRLEQEKAAIIQKHENLKQMNLSLLLRGAALEDMVIIHAHQAFSEWVRANTMHRPDRFRPAVFNDDEYPFPFNTHFSDVKNLYL